MFYPLLLLQKLESLHLCERGIREAKHAYDKRFGNALTRPNTCSITLRRRMTSTGCLAFLFFKLALLCYELDENE